MTRDFGYQPRVPQTVWVGDTIYPITYRPSQHHGSDAPSDTKVWLAEIDMRGVPIAGWGWTKYLSYMHLRDALVGKEVHRGEDFESKGWKERTG